MKKFRRANVITTLLFSTAIAILISVVYFVINIQVIKDWSLSLPSGDIHAGDTLVVASKYTKLRQVTGKSTRTIECQTQPGIFLSVPLNKVTANRAPGTTGTGILVTIPQQITGITQLPDTCHICVALSYPVMPGRTVPYFKCTKNFQLQPKTSAPSTVSVTTSQSSQSINLIAPVKPQFAVSSSQPIPQSQPVQPNNLQPATTSTPTPVKQPLIAESIMKPIMQLTGELDVIHTS